MRMLTKHKLNFIDIGRMALMPLGIALSLGTVSCLKEMPNESAPESQAADENRPLIAARNSIGSTESVTWIYNLNDLRNMRMGGNYKLANDIDASPTAQNPFVPLGFTKDFFRGTLNGNHKTIHNLNIVGTGSYTGLFTKAYNAIFKNLRFENVTVTGGYSTGVLAGYAENVDLLYSFIEGKVTGNSSGNRLGLAFGSAGNFTQVSRCYTKGRLDGTGYHFGGLIGHAAFYGNVIQNDDARIMIDQVFTQDTIAPSFPSGSAMVASGGVVGTLLGGIITNVNAVGHITGRHAAGGLVGNIINNDPNSVGSYIRGGLSRGVVSDAATPNRTGAIGMMSGSLVWSGGAYYDTDTDGGVVNPNIADPSCQVGFTSSVLKAPHPDPDKLLYPYIYGSLITQQRIDQNGELQCTLNTGSDGDWGFGTCGQTVIWEANSSSEYSTLRRIPRRSVQPK